MNICYNTVINNQFSLINVTLGKPSQHKATPLQIKTVQASKGP